jgi:hypothetical protein
MAPRSLAVNTNTLLFETQPGPNFGKLTRDGFLLIAQLTDAINDATSDFVLVDATQTLTNKTMDGDANTFTDIPTSALKSRTGNGARVVTAAAAGTSGRLVQWSTGNLVDATQVYVPAGTTTVEAMIFHAGSLMTSVTAGAVEYDGTALYFAVQAAARGVIPAVQMSVQTADRTGTNVNTAQAVFDSAQDVLTVQASTSYFFEAEYQIESTGTTGNSLGVLFALGGGASLTGIAYTAQSRDTTAATLTYRSTVATVTQVTEVVAAATERTISLRGIIRVNAGGTLTPQVQYSAAPGVAPTIRANSFFRLWPIGSNTVATVGAWA